MANLVFVHAGTTATGANGVPNIGAGFTTLAGATGDGPVGFFDVDTGLHCTGLSAGTQFIDGSVLAGTAQIVPDRFQITQQVTGSYPFATPIIRREDVLSVEHGVYDPPVAQVATFTPTTTDAGTYSEVSFMITERKGLSYSEQIDPTIADHWKNTRQKYTYSTTDGSTAETICDALRTLINADTAKHGITASGTTTLICTAATGTLFRVSDGGGADGTGTGNWVMTTAGTLGSGAGYQVKDAELKSLAYRGFMNREHFALGNGGTYADTSLNYDYIRIVCKQPMVGQTGGPAVGNKSPLTVTIYFDTLNDYTNTSGWEDVLGLATVDGTANGIIYTG